MDYSVFITNNLELLAALSASYYYLKTKDLKVRPFIWYLWFTVIIETIGLYGYILQYNYDNELFIWIKNSVFCYNRWLYNIYSFVSIILIWVFYKGIIKDLKAKFILSILVIFYMSFALGFFLFTDGFFIKSIPYDAFFETLFITAAVLFYFWQLLTSDKILFFYNEPLFYISSGLLIWYLIILPLFIFDSYFYSINQRFIGFRSNYLLIANLFLYLCYTFGFLYTLRYKKQ